MGVKVIKLESQVNNQMITLYPVVLNIGGKLFLVDCGYEESYDDLIIALNQNDINPKDLFGVIISHDDIDHVGALYKFKASFPAIKIYSSRLEEPSLAGRVKSERLTQAELFFPGLPEEHKSWAMEFQQSLMNIKRVPVDYVLDDNDVIENTWTVIHTPGHTKGHLSFYSPSLKVLIASDAVVIENGELNIANPQFTLDLPEAVRSIVKLQKLDIKTLICYHGGVLKADVAEAFKNLIERYKSYLN